MLEWISISDGLPNEGEYVMIHANSVIYHGISPCFISAFEAAQEMDNNLVPYRWRGPGPFMFHGQDVDYWARFEGPQALPEV